MLSSSLVSAVQRNTEASKSDADVLEVINRGLREISGGGEREHGRAKLAPLPDLLVSDDVTITAGDTYSDLPDDYQRGVLRVSLRGEKLRRYETFLDFMSRYEGETGTPESYCVKGRKLWVLPAPTTETDVKVYYHRYPETLQIVEYDAGPPEIEAVDSVPEGIPDELQYRLLVNFACREIFSEIEQGLDGHNPDTIKHNALYQAALTDLERLIGAEEAEATNINDEYFTEDNIL